MSYSDKPEDHDVSNPWGTGPGQWVNATQASYPKHGQRWTEQEEAQLRACCRNLLSMDHIVNQLRRSPLGIAIRILRIGAWHPEIYDLRYEIRDVLDDSDDPEAPETLRRLENHCNIADLYQPSQSKISKIKEAPRTMRFGAPTKETIVNTNHLLTLLQENYTTCDVTFDQDNDAKGKAPTYTYKISKAMADGLKAGVDGTMVVAPCQTVRLDIKFRVGRIIAIHDEPQIDVKAPYEYKWIVCTIDRTAYDEQLKREAEAIELIAKTERRRAKEEALKVLMGDTSVEELRNLLNHGNRLTPPAPQPETPPQQPE
jgi:hypothetical protein